MSGEELRAVPGPAYRLLDRVLEASVVGSFSALGTRIRGRAGGWRVPDPTALAGRVALVTGATGGLGQAIVTGLAAAGATVWVHGRDRDRLGQTLDRISTVVPGADLRTVVADLTSTDDARRMAAEVAAGTGGGAGREGGAGAGRLDLLVHNAGVLMAGYRATPDGVEYTAQTQLVAPFALTAGLFGTLSRTPGARVVAMASGGMYTRRLDVSALDPDPRSFRGAAAYALVKRAQVTLVAEAARRLADSGVTFHATHPGWVDTPGLRGSLPRFQAVMGPLLRTPEQGADTTVWLATSAEPDSANGAFWHDRGRRPVHWAGLARSRPDEADRLWKWVAERAQVGAGGTGTRERTA